MTQSSAQRVLIASGPPTSATRWQRAVDPHHARAPRRAEIARASDADAVSVRRPFAGSKPRCPRRRRHRPCRRARADGTVRAFPQRLPAAAQVAAGSGCARLVCRYHAGPTTWAGCGASRTRTAPGVDKGRHPAGMPVTASERHGLVFVTQDEPGRDALGGDWSSRSMD